MSNDGIFGSDTFFPVTISNLAPCMGHVIMLSWICPIESIRQLVQRFHVCKVFIDGSASHLIHELKHGYGEYISYEKLKPEQLDRQISSGCGEPLIVPINFQKHHKDMAKHLVKALAHKRVRINPKFDDLIISLKSALPRMMNGH